VVTIVILLKFKSSFVKEFPFLQWARQGVSALATRPSYMDEHGMNYLLHGMHVWPLVRADWGRVWV